MARPTPLAEMSGDAARHTLTDWLALHELDPPLCRQLLSAAAKQIGDRPASQADPLPKEQTLAPDLAWRGVVEALCDGFPAQHSFIETCFENISRKAVSGTHTARRALTLDNGSDGYPTIIYTYRGEASDQLLMAHEFAHALQIVASGGKFVPPVVREVCAFIGETALLSHLWRTDDLQHARLRQIRLRDDRKYLISDGRELRSALDNPDAAYRYVWNYPIARYVANRLSETVDRQRIWMIFRGEKALRHILDELKD